MQGLHWSPAAFDPTGGPGGPGTPPPGPPGTEIPRVDGGGATDPVGQAIATSQALFDDGAARRVVLATSERFPVAAIPIVTRTASMRPIRSARRPVRRAASSAMPLVSATRIPPRASASVLDRPSFRSPYCTAVG
ncbi:hypothetical protein BH23ACT9_BH23ACT9_07520 [soil metagenome]